MTYRGKLLAGALVNYSLVVVMWLILFLSARGAVSGWAFTSSLALLIAVGVIAFYRALAAVKGLAEPLERVIVSLDEISRGEVASELPAAATADAMGRLQDSCKATGAYMRDMAQSRRRTSSDCSASSRSVSRAESGLEGGGGAQIDLATFGRRDLRDRSADGVGQV